MRPLRRAAGDRHADLARPRSSVPRPARRTWGMRPVCEMQFIDFISCAYDMLTNYVATARYRAFLPCPMVVRGPSGGYVRGGPFHSQNPEAAFLHTPGLKIVYPATASDAKGLIKAAIRDDDCVLFFEHKYLYRRIKEELPEGRPCRPDRQGADCARRDGSVDHHLRGDGLEGARGRGAAGAGRRALGRGDRPALAAADGRRGDRRHGEEDQPGADRARGHRDRRHRRRDHGADQRAVRSSGWTRRCAGWRRTTCRCRTRRRWRISCCRRRRHRASGEVDGQVLG